MKWKLSQTFILLMKRLLKRALATGLSRTMLAAVAGAGLAAASLPAQAVEYPVNFGEPVVLSERGQPLKVLLPFEGTPNDRASAVAFLVENAEVPNALPLENIPLGTIVHNIELRPRQGAALVRSAGTFAQITSREDKYVIVKLPSGETCKILGTCKATVGSVGNADHSLERSGKAGRSRWLGIRPRVRGVAINPVDHPIMYWTLPTGRWPTVASRCRARPAAARS